MFLAIYTAKYGEKQNLNHCVKKKIITQYGQEI